MDRHIEIIAAMGQENVNAVGQVMVPHGEEGDVNWALLLLTVDWVESAFIKC